MLRSFYVDGYKGLKDARLDFQQDGPTVLLGPNGSGKTSLLEALAFAYDVSQSGLMFSGFRQGLFERVVCRRDLSQRIVLRAETSEGISWEVAIGEKAIVEERLRHDARTFSRKSDFAPQATMLMHLGAPWDAMASAVKAALGPVRIASFNPARVAAPSEPEQDVAVDGFGVSSALLRLQNSRRKSFTEIERKFCDLFPSLEEVQTPLARDQNRHQVLLQFLERGAKESYPADQMASGMLLALALLWLVMRPEPDRILCYEEPENSLHPYLLAQVYDLLGKAARGELGAPPVQVIVATHSVDFVNLCKAEEIRVCARDAEGATRVHRISDDQELQEALEAYRGALGQLWYSGAFGGSPR